MSYRTVELPGPLTLVPGRSLDLHTRQKALDHPRLPRDAEKLVADLNARADGIPVRIVEPRRAGGDRSLLLHGSGYVAQLYLTNRADAYSIARIDPLRMRDFSRLAESCLLVHPTRWQLCRDYRQIPQNSDAHWQRLLKEWERAVESVAIERGATPIPEHHADFLDIVDRVIDATRTISSESVSSTPPYPYRSVAATGGQRQGTRAVYEFRLAGEARPEEGAFVQLRGRPELRGQVTRCPAAGDTATIRFDRPVDFRRLDPQGELVVTPGTAVFDRQREAVALLRDGHARSPRLLDALVDHRVGRLRPAPATPAGELDPDQLDAFRKALAVEDLLLVQGPPGTGKTRTIAEIVGAAAGSGRRDGPVLVTSHTHRAVDNALSRLPSGLVTVRVGNEGRVTEEGRPFLLERQAADLREEILRSVGLRLDEYADIGNAEHWARELGSRLEDLDVSLQEAARARDAHAAARRDAGGPAQLRVEALGAEHRRHEQTAARLRRRVDRLAGARSRAARYGARRLTGFPFRMLEHVLGRRLATARSRVLEQEQLVQGVAEELAAAERDLDVMTRDLPSVRAARVVMEQAERLAADTLDRAVTAARAAVGAVPAAEVPPAVPRRPTPAELGALRTWLDEHLPLLAARGQLLRDWHEEVSGAVDQLYPELIRYAHVVAATCIGVASRAELSGIDFSLAVVDEAGQIGVTDALVPLVRARRAVLVGDHQQLPPFLDSEVEAWGRDLGDPAVKALLSRSVLEILMPGMPDDHRVLLTRQRRMPSVIADFVSGVFYDGKLRTEVRRDHRDPLFRTPMAFVDTSGLPIGRRKERQGRCSERFGQRGYINEVECELLSELAALYDGRGTEWAVIVPYQAQRAEITARLTRIVDPDRVGLNVGTVDSFQGGERDVILYGFTRSNRDGRVGFLKELRRANVAFTRAKQQLVLVGDLSTLTAARDTGFRQLVRSLETHLRQRGEIRPYQEIRDRVTALGEARGRM